MLRKTKLWYLKPFSKLRISCYPCNLSDTYILFSFLTYPSTKGSFGFTIALFNIAFALYIGDDVDRTHEEFLQTEGSKYTNWFELQYYRKSKAVGLVTNVSTFSFRLSKIFDNQYFHIWFDNYYLICFEYITSDEERSSHLRLGLLGLMVIINIPFDIIKPYELGNSIFPKIYGFSYFEDVLSIHYGPYTYDSLTTKYVTFSNPFLQRELVSKTFNRLETTLPWPILDAKDDEDIPDTEWVYFVIRDCDDEIILCKAIGECFIYERGQKRFRWLRNFFEAEKYYRVEIKYGSEQGRRKNDSWKGGTMSVSFVLKNPKSFKQEIIIKLTKSDGVKYVRFINLELGLKLLSEQRNCNSEEDKEAFKTALQNAIF